MAAVALLFTVQYMTVSGNIGNLVCGSGASCRAFGEHVFVKITSRSVELVDSQGGYDDTR